MSPITDTQTEPSTAHSAPASKQETSSGQPSDEALGYEVLYGRRISGVQVPLSLLKSLSAPQAPKYSTGSALLDSFIGNRPAEPAPLRNLSLINVARRPQGTVPADKPRQKTAYRGVAPQVAPKIAAPPTKSKKNRQPPAPSLKSAPPKIKDSDQPVVARRMPSATMRLPDVPPPAEAEPEVLPEVTKRAAEKVVEKTAKKATEKVVEKTAEKTAEKATKTTPKSASVSAPEKRVAPPALSKKQPHPAPAHTQKAPAFSRQPSASDKEARDNAASVGLLDLDDALLFGGEHQNLGSTDAFITAAESSAPGVLSYITLQASAFTVTELKSDFPYNTNPEVINRIDPPKQSTVLDLQHFKLGNLTNLDKEPPELKQTQPPQQTANDEVSTLSQQVKMLNQKIASLSQQLAQVVDDKTDS